VSAPKCRSAVPIHAYTGSTPSAAHTPTHATNRVQATAGHRVTCRTPRPATATVSSPTTDTTAQRRGPNGAYP